MRTKVTRRCGVEPKWAWHYRRLVWLRDRLLQERSHLVGAWTPQNCPSSPDIAETAADEYDRDLDFSSLSFDQEMLYEVEGALKRIENHTYGVCESTGKPIPAARLKAVPWTRFAIQVQAQLEREGAVGWHHLGTRGSVQELPAAPDDFAEEPAEE